MLGELVKRAVNVVVVGLAAIAFFLVPFGRRTLFEHVRAILATDAAGELGREIKAKGEAVAQEVERGVRPSVSAAAASASTALAPAPHGR